jgi:hypothetical protein
MTQNLISTDVAYRIASEHQAALRREVAQARATQTDSSQIGEPLPPTRGPLAALRRRLAGAAAFA